MRYLILLVLIAAAAVSAAKPPFLKVFFATYDIDPKSVIGKTRCLNCHEAPGPPNRNPYGRLVKATLDANGQRMVTPELLKSLESKDMGEGQSFGQKIRKDLPPGQPLPPAPIPAEWEARYRSLESLYQARSLNGIKRILADYYVYVPSSGKPLDRKAALAEAKSLFQAASIEAEAKVTSYRGQGDEVQIGFEWVLAVTGKDKKTLRVREVGTDYWRKMRGKWMLVKTVDKLMEELPPSSG